MTALRSTGRRPKAGPLGGAETAFVALAEALARRGHQVEVRNRCRAALCHKGVRWAPLSGGVPAACDLYIGNRGHRVIGLVRRARRRLFWLHNPGGYLKKPRNLWRLAWYRPILVTTGAYHAATVPRWLPCGGREIIPYGVLDRFRAAVAARAAAAARRIHLEPAARARLAARSVGRADCARGARSRTAHLCRAGGLRRCPARNGAEEMETVLARADALAALRCPPLRSGRPGGSWRRCWRAPGSMLYRGDPGETFCLSLAEAQAMGVPAVVSRWARWASA